MSIKINDVEYPKFIFGSDIDGNEYLTHLGSPQFVCKIETSVTEDGEEQEALFDFFWIDAEPEDKEFEALMSDAEQFIDAYTVAMEDLVAGQDEE